MARKNKKIELKFKSVDYSTSLLPTTRRAQFKDIYSHEFKTLLLLGAWLLVFFIPFLLVENYSNIFIYTYLEQNNANLTTEEMRSFELVFTLIKEFSLL